MSEVGLQKLLQRVGSQHKFQYLLFIAFAVKWMIAAMLLFSLNFFYYVPDFSCSPTQMQGQSSCPSFVCANPNPQFWFAHLPNPLPSIALDYGIRMVCSQQWLSSLLQSLIYMGSFVGYLIMPHLADNVGRRPTQGAAWLLCAVGQGLLLASTNLTMVGVGTFLIGFGANSAITLHYTFIKELIAGITRQRMIIALQIAFSIGLSLISAISLAISNWKHTLILTLTLTLLMAFTYFWIEETLAFSLKKGKEVLLLSLNKIAKINNIQAIEMGDLDQLPPQQPSTTSFVDLFKYFLRITIVCGVVNMLIEFIYDGTILSLSKIGVNVYVNQIMVGVVEIAAAVFSSFIVPKVKRRQFLCICFVVIGVLTLVLGIETFLFDHTTDEINLHSIAQILILALIRFFIDALWGVFFVYVAQLYPYEVSSLSFGWVSIMGNLGASAAPFIRLLTAKFTMLMISICSFLMAFTIRLLHQTIGLPIPPKIIRVESETVKSGDVY